MAKWTVAANVRSGPHRSYIGWVRRHPNIHAGKEPMSKLSLVQIHEDGPRCTILAQTTAHGILTQPIGTKGTTLFKKTIVKKTLREAKTEAAKLKRYLASRYDGLTRHYAKGPKYD